jgi:hypothetical protein
MSATNGTLHGMHNNSTGSLHGMPFTDGALHGMLNTHNVSLHGMHIWRK